MKWVLATAILLLMPVACFAAPGWTVETAESSLGFQVSQGGGNVEGVFRRFEAKIAFDPDDLATSRIQVSIDVASVTTGAADRDQELPKPDWFDTARFPRATFTAETFRALGNGDFVADGSLMLRDTKLAITLPFKLDLLGNGIASIQGKVDIDRTAFGIGQGAWATSDIVGRKVTVIVRLKAHRDN